MKTSEQISFDPFDLLRAIASNIQKAIKDHDSEEITRIDSALLWQTPFEVNLAEMSECLVTCGLLTSYERDAALNLLPAYQ
jgi:hypothetical protein